MEFRKRGPDLSKQPTCRNRSLGPVLEIDRHAVVVRFVLVEIDLTTKVADASKQAFRTLLQFYLKNTLVRCVRSPSHFQSMEL